MPKASGSPSSCSDCVSVSRLCSWGWGMQSGLGSELGRDRSLSWGPPPPRDLTDDQWTAPGMSSQVPALPGLRPRPGASLHSLALWIAGRSNTRSGDPGPGREERMLAGAPHPSSPTWAAPVRSGIGGKGEGRQTGSAAAAVGLPAVDL